MKTDWKNLLKKKIPALSADFTREKQPARLRWLVQVRNDLHLVSL